MGRRVHVVRTFWRRHVSDRAVAQEALTDEQRWRRHQIRQIAVLITLPAILIGTGSIAAAWSVGLMHHVPAPQCVPVVVDAPARDAFQIRVLNGSGVSGAAAYVSKELGKRGFVVVEASTAPTDIYVRGPARIFHGPDSLDPALLLALQIDGAELTDDGRTGVVLTMVLGAGYADLVPAPDPVPPVPAEVQVNVWNTTWHEGLAASAGADLAARGFVIVGTGNDPQNGFLPDDVAVIRYGPEGELAAKLLSEQVTGVRLTEDARAGATVDLVLGNNYTTLRPAADIPPVPPRKPVPKATVSRPCTPS